MKTKRILTLSLVSLFFMASTFAQSADDVIGNYVKAIGGQKLLSKITSLYMESTMDVQGMEGMTRTTILNGKGMLQETDIMGSVSSTCYTDKGGWSINPMAGISSPEPMPESQYESGKFQIFIGGPFVKGASEGYQFEMTGRESVGGKSAYVIKMTLPDGTASTYLFDPDTYYMIRSTMEIDAQGQVMELEVNYSDYRKTEAGHMMPFSVDINVNDQFTLNTVVQKVEMNKDVDPAIFAMPE